MIAANSIDAPAYMATPMDSDDGIIARALAILSARIKCGPLMGSPREVREYLTADAPETVAAALNRFIGKGIAGAGLGGRKRDAVAVGDPGKRWYRSGSGPDRPAS